MLKNKIIGLNAFLVVFRGKNGGKKEKKKDNEFNRGF